MPALSGEPWRGLSKVSLVTTATGLGRHWTLSVDDVDPITATGDQTTWDFEGDSTAVTLRVEWATDVGSVIGAPDTINVQVRLPGTGSIVGSTWTFAPAGDSGSQTRTLHFDLDPLDQSLDVAANRRWGALELYLQVIDDPGGTTNDYTLDSRGTASVGPPALTTYSWARGYIRQKATISSALLSNVSAGGAEPASWAYPDPIHVRVSTTTPPFESNIGSGTIALRRPQGEGGSAERSKGIGNIVSATTDTSFTNIDTSPSDNAVGIGMFLGSEAKDFDFTLPTNDFGGDNKYAWASSQPAGFSVPSALLLRYVGRITVDPRITFTHLFQLNDPVYGTPPSSKDVSPAVRLAVDFGFVSARATNARGDGTNGITWTTKMWDDGELSGSEVAPVVDHSTVSASEGGQAGWADELTSWNQTGPGGLWQKKVIITSPGNATTLETGNTATLTLIASDPRIVLNVASGDPTAPGTHWFAGRQLTIGARLFQEFTPVSTDAGTGLVSILRFNAATGRLQYLTSVSPAVWTDIVNGTPITTYAMSASPGDADIQLKTFTAAETADFGTNDLFIIAQLKRTGAPYQSFEILDSVGTFFRHDQAAAAASIAESAILFDGTSGHQHTGGTDGRAIGDRG